MDYNQLEIKETLKLHNNVYLIKTEDQKKYIIKKTNKYKCNFFKKIIDENYSFNIEIDFYKYFRKNNGFSYTIPALYDYKYNHFIMIEFIEGNVGWNKHILKEKFLVAALLDFKYNNRFFKTKLLRKFRMNLSNAAEWKIIKILIKLTRKKKISLLHFCKGLVILVKGALEKNTKSKFILHNDLHSENIIINDKKEVSFLDFERITVGKKWFLIDIIDLSFNLETLKFDDNLLNEYYLSLVKDGYILSHKHNLSLQIRIALLRRVLHGIISPTIKKENKEKLLSFLINNLLSNKVFKKWMEVENNTVFVNK